MIKAEIRKLGDVFPLATAIIIAPTAPEAIELGKKELNSYFPPYPYRIGFEGLGPIMFEPTPIIVFLYTQTLGQIKK